MKRRKKKGQTEGIEKLDAILMEMTKQVQATDQEIRKVQASKESRRSDDEFFTMISRRVREMSPTTQRWVEDQIWGIYRQARRREEVGAVASMQNATFTQSFRSLQPYIPEPTQRQQQPSTSNTGNEVSAADIIAMSFDMCNE